MASFEKAFKYSFGNEGGYVNHPRDKGGPTNFGITIKTLSRWLGRKATIEDVKKLTPAQARAIYKAWYWDVHHLDEVKSDAIAICIFDIGLVRGVTNGAKYAQRVAIDLGVKYLAVDGRIGPASLRALDKCEASSFVVKYSALAKAGFEAIVARDASQGVFLKGWRNRAKRLLSLV